MNTRNPILVLALACLLLTVTFEYGASVVGPTAGDPEQLSPPTTPVPTPTPNPVPLATSPTTTPASESTTSGENTIQMRVARVDPCGSTCRDVTAHLRNEGAADVTNVQVYTTIYAGEDIIWVDAERVGTVRSGEAYTTTKRVQISPGDILKIHSNDGTVTVETVIESDQGTEVVTEDIDVT